MYFKKYCSEYKLSSGQLLEKKPEICPACKSNTIILFIFSDSKQVATTEALIGALL